MFNIFSKYTLNKKQSEIAKVVIEQRILEINSLKKTLEDNIKLIKSNDFILFELYRSEINRLYYLQKGSCSNDTKKIQEFNKQLEKHGLSHIDTNLELIDYSCDNVYLTMINYLDIMEDLGDTLNRDRKEKFPKYFLEDQRARRLFIYDKLLKPFLALRTNYRIEKLNLILYLYNCDTNKKIQLTKEFLILKEKENIDGVFEDMPYKLGELFGKFFENNLKEIHSTDIDIYGTSPEEMSESFRKTTQHLYSEESTSSTRYF